MSETRKVSNTRRIFPALIFALLYLFCSFSQICASIVGDVSFLPFHSLFVGVTGIIIGILSFALFLAFATRRFLPLFIVPALFAVSLGIVTDSAVQTLTAILDIYSVAFAGAVIFLGYKRGENKAWVCAVASFGMLALEALGTFLLILFQALDKGVKFSTFFFGMIDDTINSFILLYNELLDKAIMMSSEISPDIAASAASVSSEQLYDSMALVFALMPALIYCGFFALVFIASTVFDYTNKKFAFLPERAFLPYAVSSTTFVIFTILGIIFVFSLFFEYEISSFTFTLGILSVILAVIPHFLILGYRRIYRFSSRFCGKGGAVILILIISFAAIAFSFQMFLCILAFLGTSEYRSQNPPRLQR